MLRILLLLLSLSLAMPALAAGEGVAPTPSSEAPPRSDHPLAAAKSGTSGLQGDQGAGQPPRQDPSMYPLFIMIGGMILFMWLFIFRPQRKEEKRKREMLGATKRGDEVETIGGLRGTVESVGEQTMDVRLGKDPGVVVTFTRVAVHRNLSQEPSSPAAPKK